jgi:hypothetical protein
MPQTTDKPVNLFKHTHAVIPALFDPVWKFVSRTMSVHYEVRVLGNCVTCKLVTGTNCKPGSEGHVHTGIAKRFNFSRYHCANYSLSIFK